MYRKSYVPKSPITFTEIETRPCTPKDFIFNPKEENPEAIFYPTMRTLSDLEWFGDSFICIKNREDMFGFGNYQTTAASVIMVVWERCDPKKNAEK